MIPPVIPADDPDAPARLAAAWRAGRLTAFPTETVYGVGAAADFPDARARLAALKGSDPRRPFQRLMADFAAARAATGPWSDLEDRLARRAWPGPLTLILPARATAAGDDGGGTIGIRVPDYPPLLAALALLGGGGVWASSANPAKAPPWTDARALAEWGAGALALVVARPAGEAAPGPASTVARITAGRIEIARAGRWTARDLERLAGDAPEEEGLQPLPRPVE